MIESRDRISMIAYHGIIFVDDMAPIIADR